ncbi:MAG: c-type cytochrome [Burkholderiales bacterium]
MPISDRAACMALLASLLCTPALAGPDLGTPIDERDIASWDISIPPSGTGLPPGSGTARQGVVVYQQMCQSCHGAEAAGKPADPLVGGIGTLATPKALRTVTSYWPYATTLFDYVRRAMPYQESKTLSNDELYSVTAYLLAKDSIVAEDFVLDAKTLPAVRMPNRDGFIGSWPERR